MADEDEKKPDGDETRELSDNEKARVAETSSEDPRDERRGESDE